jgi:hypothetical protein
MDRFDFPRNRRRGARFSAIRFEKGNCVDVQDVLLVDSHRRNRFHRSFSRTHSNDRRRHVACDLRFQGIRSRLRIVP